MFGLPHTRFFDFRAQEQGVTSELGASRKRLESIMEELDVCLAGVSDQTPAVGCVVASIVTVH